jgi:hypothetical protein
MALPNGKQIAIADLWKELDLRLKRNQS